jgi:hypothetical protein
MCKVERGLESECQAIELTSEILDIDTRYLRAEVYVGILAFGSGRTRNSSNFAIILPNFEDSKTGTTKSYKAMSS